MARRNSRFVNQKVIIGNKSIQAEDLTDSAKDELGADSDFVKTVQNFPGANITTSSINPSSIANQNELITSVGALTTGGILTISRDGGNSFMNFASSQFTANDPELSVSPSPTGWTFYTKFSTGSVPLTTNGRLTVNLQTPVQNQQDLLHFFNVNAGADDDYIHSVQILDEAPSNNYDYALNDEDGNLQYLTLLDSIPYGDPRLSQNGVGDNRVDIVSSQRLWEGIEGARLANGVPDFTFDPANSEYTRNTYSRLRFRTRKSVPALETGGAPATYQLNAPEGPLGVGVSSPVWSLVSDRFVYTAANITQAQGLVSGYTSGGLGGNHKIEKFSFTSPGNATDIGDLTVARTKSSSSSSSTHGYTAAGEYPLGNLTTIDRFSFAAGGNAVDVGDLVPSSALQWMGGNTSTTAGYTGGGQPNTGTRLNIYKYPFASATTNATITNYMAPIPANYPEQGSPSGSGRYSTAGLSSATHGYYMGGQPNANSWIIDKFPFNAPGYATLVGSLSSALTPGNPGVAGAYGLAGSNSASEGFGAGAVYQRTRIVKIPFATDTNATIIPALLASNKYNASGTSSGGAGYVSGGAPPAPVAITIQKYPFASNVNATSIGNLTSPQNAEWKTGQQI